MIFFTSFALATLAGWAAVDAAECQTSQLINFATSAMQCVAASGVDVTNFATVTPTDMTKACKFAPCSSLFTAIGGSGLTCTMGGHSVTEVGASCSASTPTTATPSTISLPATTSAQTTAPPETTSKPANTAAQVTTRVTETVATTTKPTATTPAPNTAASGSKSSTPATSTSTTVSSVSGSKAQDTTEAPVAGSTSSGSLRTPSKVTAQPTSVACTTGISIVVAAVCVVVAMH